uniref:Uncharacterized protein n=1 Tax=Dicentrarchus labrax TaxID=13489 RepID=A0A8P4KTI3_DICLA
MCHTLICFSIHLALKVMTKPKARSCPYCGASIMAGHWGQNTIKHRNGTRVVASAHVAVSKLAAFGYNPILFIGRKQKRVNTVNAEMITYMCPGGDGPVKPFLEKMSRAYEYIIKNSQRMQLPEAPSPSPTPQSTCSPSQPSSPPHPPDPSTFLPSTSHPQMDYEEETYTLTLVPVQPPSTASASPSQKTMTEIMCLKSSTFVTGVSAQCSRSPTPTISLTSATGEGKKKRKTGIFCFCATAYSSN